MRSDLSLSLEMLDPGVFKRRADAFRRMNLELMKEDDFFESLLHVLTPPGANGTSFPTSTLSYPAGTSLWRARKLAPEDRSLPLQAMNKLSDAWEAPADRVLSPGRLNKVGEALLYTCIGEPTSVADEIGVEDGEKFLLIRYRSKSPISLTAIGLPLSTDHLSVEAARNAEMLTDFLGEQFLRKRSEGSREYYLSESIAKNFFDLPPEVHDGWAYPSVTTEHAVNATFRAEVAHAKLSLEGVAVCEVERKPQVTNFRAVCYTGCEVEDENFVWYSQGSDFQRQVFPEFQ